MWTWDFPAIIIPALLVAVAASFLLIRAATGSKPAEFACKLCGAQQRGVNAKQWRYCPYCGAPRGAKGLHELPRRVPRDADEIKAG